MDKKKKERNQNGECSLKRNRIKLVLGLNIPLENSLDALQGRPGYKVSGLSFKFALFLKRNFSA
jgi:hypothetical protein